MDCQFDSPFFSPHTSNLAARAGMMFKKSHTTRNVRKHAKLFFPKPVLGSCAIIFFKAAPPGGCTLNRTVIHRTKSSNRQYHNMCQKHFKNKIALHDSTHRALIFFGLIAEKVGGMVPVILKRLGAHKHRFKHSSLRSTTSGAQQPLVLLWFR